MLVRSRQGRWPAFSTKLANGGPTARAAMSTERTYTIILDPEPDGSTYNVRVPALPGVFTWGATVEEAIERAKEAIELHVECLIEDGESVPEETPPPQVVAITVAA